MLDLPSTHQFLKERARYFKPYVVVYQLEHLYEICGQTIPSLLVGIKYLNLHFHHHRLIP